MKQTKLIILIITIISSMLVILFTYNILSTDRIYEGVYIKDVYVGGETKENAFITINQTYKAELSHKEIELIDDSGNRQIKYSKLGVKYDINEAINKAYEIGREGNLIQRLLKIFKTKRENIIVPLNLSINSDNVKDIIKNIASKTDLPAKEYQIEIEDDKIAVTKGINGKSIDIEKSVQNVMKAIKLQNKTVTLLYKEINPKSINFEELYKKVYIQTADAYYKIKNHSINIIPHIVGRKIDKEEAEHIIAQSIGKQKFYIPLYFIQPKLTKDKLEQELFKDKLTSYTTSFDVNKRERSHNIELAASRINGVVLGPGDIFSFNEIVGERTLERGFQTATGYFGDKLVDDVGGGICQVSTTLYNIVLYSNLEVIRRSSHSMTVGYVPFGQDAAVAYDVLDFQFKNNNSFPIKILSKVENGKVTFELYGTNEMTKKTVEIENIIVKTIKFPVEFIEDPLLENGKTKVKQYGKNGYIVDTYKVIKLDDKEISKELITKSSYLPLKQIVYKGIKGIKTDIENVTT